MNENFDNDDRRKLEAKRQKRMEREATRESRRKKSEPRREKNVIGLIGFIVACNAFWISFTGWYIWLDLIALVMCLIGLLPNRPKNIKKYLALFGAGIAVIAMFNAIRVSNQWIVDDSNFSSVSAYSVEYAAEEIETEQIFK